MKIEYRDEDFKYINDPETYKKKSRWYKHFLAHGKLKIREQYHSDALFALHYYLDPEDNETELLEKYRDIPALEILSFRTRNAYGDLWVETVKYYDFDSNTFSNLIIRELYDARNFPIAWECTDPALPETDTFHYQLLKSYYNTDSYLNGEYFDSRFHSGRFTDIEHFPQGMDTDSQDLERGIIGIQAEQLMQRMKILPKMRAWYVNNEFLPQL
ncbi:hypothetical protein [Chryseobacterium oranimense]|uniref:hypothetical protein n=1 Tax=Chryseobacterium oranimense TaxID=421058 RepID=UPI002235A76F|nr:hypothetical protein [Chryseobacterium oranimense]